MVASHTRCSKILEPEADAVAQLRSIDLTCFAARGSRRAPCRFCLGRRANQACPASRSARGKFRADHSDCPTGFSSSFPATMRKTSLPRAISKTRSSASRRAADESTPPRNRRIASRFSAAAPTRRRPASQRNNLTFDPVMESEGYVLVIDPHEAAIVGATGSGIFYGVQTFKQLLPLPGAPRVLPTGTVRDWPAMQYRGIDDDLSRGPFPTLDFQKHQIRVFASFKINIYSPYFEHTLLYPDQPLAAPPGSCAHARAGQGTRRLRPPVSHHHRARAGVLRPSASRAQVGALPG